MIDFDDVCETVRKYAASIPREGGSRDDWRTRLDDVLADIRHELCTYYDRPENAEGRQMTTTNTPAPSELLPCPFCGAEPSTSTRETESLWSSNIVTYTKIECEECGISFDTEPDHSTSSHEAWNSRTPAPSEAITQPSGELVAWQWRFKLVDGAWSDWNDGRVRYWVIEVGREYEERPLYASPSTEVERLTREVERLRAIGIEMSKFSNEHFLRSRSEYERAETAEATNRSLEERLAEERAETVKVLEPFVVEYEPWMDKYHDATLTSFFKSHTFGQLRDARAFLTKLKEGQSNG